MVVPERTVGIALDEDVIHRLHQWHIALELLLFEG